MKIETLMFLLILGLFVSSCEEEIVEEPPVVNCDTDGVTYTADISPIFNGSCALAGCHVVGGNAPFPLDDFESSVAAVGFGRILGSIRHEPGFIAMPFPAGSPMIPECDIDQIEAWINDGTPE